MDNHPRSGMLAALPVLLAAVLVFGCTRAEKEEFTGPQQELQRVFHALASAFDPKEPPVDRYMHKVEESLKDAPDEQSKAIAQYKLGLAVTYSDSDVPAEEARFNSALEISKAAGYKKGEAAAIAALALREDCKGNGDKARDLLQQAIAAHEALGLKLDLATDYVNLGMIEGNAGNRQKSLEALDKAVSLAKEAKYDLVQATALANQCGVYASADDLVKAKQAYDALQVYRSLGLPYFLYYRKMIATEDMPPVADDAVSENARLVAKAKPGERVYYSRALLAYMQDRRDPVLPCGFVETPYFLP